jgi:hypothetical protein
VLGFLRLPRSLLIGRVGPEEEPRVGTPDNPGLTGNHPNPFGLETTMEYAVPRHGHGGIEVYDLVGRRVRLLADGAGTGVSSHRVGRPGPCRAWAGEYLSRIIVRSQGGRLFRQSGAMLLLQRRE